MMDLRFTGGEEAFRRELCAFLDANLPPEKQVGDEIAPEPDYEFEKQFLRVMGREGWLVPAWPREYGGRGADYIQQLIFHEVVGYYRAPMTMASDTLQFIGPTLVTYGTEEQKREFLPPIARGEVWWAQGFSEPGAGSDLAAIETHAELDGDEFVVNGTKIWTGMAQHCSWYFLLCRTDPAAPRHRGLSLLLLPLSAPGLTMRPIIDMAGRHYFNQVYLEGVRVPRRNLLGELNRGWYAAMTTLEFERSGVQLLGPIRRFLDELLQHAREAQGRDGRPLIADPLTAQKLGEAQIEVETARWLCYRAAWLFASGRIPNRESSQSKVFITETIQRVYQRALEVLGPFGHVGHGSPRWARLSGRPPIGALWSMGQSIGGGTNEIQRNLIATRGLGLPRG